MDRENHPARVGNPGPVVTIAPSGKQFSTLPHASLLESGLGAGVALPYRCSNGTCGDCRARVVSGEVEPLQFHDYVLSNAEKAANVILMCSHRAVTDVEIEVSEATDAEDIPLQQVNTRICHLESSDGTLIVRMKILRGKALWYLAGQYATVHLPGIAPRLLPIASCPCEAGYLEFHLTELMEEETRAVEQLAKRERIQIEGPQGSFTVRDSELSQYHHVFIAVEHRFAVVKPMIEHVIATECEAECTLLRVSANPYKNNLCRSWADAFDWFSYHTVTDVASLPEVFPAKGIGKPVKVYASASGDAHRWLQAWLATIDAPHIVTDHYDN